jgi:hypothetical protein
MQSNSSTFVARYGVVLESAARRVHALVGRGQPYTTTGDVADYIVNNLPTMCRKTWGKNLRAWRVKNMLANASFLGAFDDLDIVAVRGKGLTTRRKPRLKVAA